MKKKKNNFYAYYLVESRQSAIVETWDECQQNTKRQNARYKGFETKDQANEWLNQGAEYEIKPKIKKVYKPLQEGIYFDAGTGRGDGVEVRLTNKNKDPLLNQILNKDKINKHDNYNLGKLVTNNYGELVGLYLALKLANKLNIKHIFGDSKLVIDYWSKGFSKIEDKKTIDLIKKVKILRKEFETEGGHLEHISGDINPADLGFHK
ncbi:MAG: ribonuclease H family protein [Candidatus Woesearchaeota archaeon]|jgi:viroplasmin and RNaseH domain-containing protein|nr:ribonuclease H family protein [Candidatus Woesearchaeota archaeon]